MRPRARLGLLFVFRFVGGCAGIPLAEGIPKRVIVVVGPNSGGGGNIVNALRRGLINCGRLVEVGFFQLIQFGKLEVLEAEVINRERLEAFIDAKQLVERVLFLVAVWQAVAVLIVVVVV